MVKKRAQGAAVSKQPGRTRKPTSGDQAQGRRTIVVLGMHRSGTSALTRVLNLCGAELPGKLMVAEYGMPGDGNRLAGFWESQTLTDIDNEIMAAAGSAWDSLLEPSRSWFESGSARSFIARLAEGLREELGEAALTVVKDPRICRLVPIWREALVEAGRTPA
jgi:hypothetical protein